MTASSSPTPLPERLPHIAVILLWYPLFTQPFIFRDVESLRSRLPVSVITLYGRNLRHCSEEMKEAARAVHTMGTAALPTILALSSSPSAGIPCVSCMQQGKAFCTAGKVSKPLGKISGPSSAASTWHAR